MCLGRTHALAALTAGMATAGPVLHLHRPADLAAYLATCAGAGVLPDLDHPRATLAHTFGFMTKGFAWLVGKVSGGHRHGTHSLIGVAVFTGMAAAAVHWRHDPAGRTGLMVLLSLLFAGALCSLDAARLAAKVTGIRPLRHAGDLAAIGGAAVMVATGTGLATVAAATGIGCAAHIATDMLTDSGCPLLWPVRAYRFKLWPEPLAFTTGTRPESMFASALLLALAALCWREVLTLHAVAHATTALRTHP